MCALASGAADVVPQRHGSVRVPCLSRPSFMFPAATQGVLTYAWPPLQVLGIHDAQRQMGAIEQHAVVHQGCRRVNGQTHQPCEAI